MSDQTAKADGGKLRLTLVPMEMVEAAAKIKEYEKQADNRLAPKMICKTRKKKGSWYGLFKCPYCGEKFEASVSNVMRGRQHSCGCMKGKFLVESKNTHGASKTRLYRTYTHIKERCDTPTCKEYKWYGARGIKCEFASFEEFRDFALSHGYNDSLTVERIDVDGNYCKDNITFIPQALQSRNRTNSVKLTYKGLTLCASEWAQMLGFKPDTLTNRKRHGWSDQKTLETMTNNSLDIKLIPVEMIGAIRAVRLFGISKYKDPENWRKVEKERYRDAACRHAIAYLKNPSGLDAESGLPHLYHLACNIAFLCALEIEDGTLPKPQDAIKKMTRCEPVQLTDNNIVGSGVYIFADELHFPKPCNSQPCKDCDGDKWEKKNE